MPLHLSLGLGKQVLDLVKNEASSGTGRSFHKQTETFNQESSKQQQLLDEAKEALNSVDDPLQTFLNETAPFHEKQGKRWRVVSTELSEKHNQKNVRQCNDE